MCCSGFGCSFPASNVHFASVMFPLLVSIAGILLGFITLIVRSGLYPVKEEPSVEKALKGVLVISTILMTPTVRRFACLMFSSNLSLTVL